MGSDNSGVPPHRDTEEKVAVFTALAETRRLYFKAMQHYGSMSIRGVQIVNGGALVTLLALVGHLAGDGVAIETLARELQHTLYWFVGGIVCATVAAGAGYLNFAGHLDGHPQIGAIRDFAFDNKAFEGWYASWLARLVNVTASLGVMLVLLGIACFATGSFLAFKALASLKSAPVLPPL